MKNIDAAARSSSVAPSSSAQLSVRIGIGAVETGAGAGAAGGGGGGAGAVGGRTGAQAASSKGGAATKASFQFISFFPLAAVAIVFRTALRGAGKAADQPADRGALTRIAAKQPGDQRAYGGARRRAAQRSTIGRARRRSVIIRPWTKTRRAITGGPGNPSPVMRRRRSRQQGEHRDGQCHRSPHPHPHHRPPRRRVEAPGVFASSARDHEFRQGWRSGGRRSTLGGGAKDRS